MKNNKQILEEAKAFLESNGWTIGIGNPNDGPTCAIGAIAHVLNPGKFKIWDTSDALFTIHHAEGYKAIEVLASCIPGTGPEREDKIMYFNDKSEESSRVLEAFDCAIAKAGE